MIAPIPSSIYIQVDSTHAKQAYVPLSITILLDFLKARDLKYDILYTLTPSITKVKTLYNNFSYEHIS